MNWRGGPKTARWFPGTLKAATGDHDRRHGGERRLPSDGAEPPHDEPPSTIAIHVGSAASLRSVATNGWF